jgi:hypothetical protein
VGALWVGSVATTGSISGKPWRRMPRRMLWTAATGLVLPLTVLAQGLDELVFGHRGATLDAGLSSSRA